MNAIVKSATLAVDPSRTLQAMRHSFTNKRKAFSELLQNAARSGATAVHVTWDRDAKTLVVEDNGSGIADFDTLLSFGSSGWSEEVMERDSPFGIGFLAGVFAAEEIEVESNGLRLTAKSAQILSMQPVLLQSSSRTVGTRVVLYGYNVDLQIGRILDGYPIPVFFNSTEVERPHAVDQGTWIDSPIGKIRMPDQLPRPEQFIAYLQGFQIESGAIFPGDSAMPVVHLDPKLFKGRLPDRDRLVEPEDWSYLIREAMREVIRARLTRELAEDRDRCLVTHAKGILNWSLTDLFNGLDALPGQFFSTANSPEERGGVVAATRLSGVLSRHDLSKRRLLSDGKVSSPVEELYAHLMGVTLVNALLVHSLSKSHWLHALLNESEAPEQPEEQSEIEEASVVVEAIDCRDNRHVTVSYVEADVRLCSSIKLHGVFGTATVEGNHGVCLSDGSGAIIYVTASTTVDVLKQVVHCEDLSEAQFYEAAREFRLVMADMLGTPPSELLQQLLRHSDVVNLIPRSCFKQAFRVEVDECGRMTLSAFD